MSITVELEQQAKKLLEQQQFGPAHKVLEQWLTQEPDNAEAHYLMAGAYGYTGNFPLAEKHCRRALDIIPNYFEALFRLANSLDGQGKLDQALQVFKQAAEINPDFPHLWNNMGACYMSQQAHVDAERCYRKALGLNSESPEFHCNLALALIPQSIGGSKKLTEAIQLIQKAEEFNIDLADQLYFDNMLGISFLAHHAPKQAEKCFRQSLDFEKDNAEPNLNLALSLVAQGREKEALTVASHAQQSWVKEQSEMVLAEIYWTLSLIYLGLGNYAKGWPLYEYRWQRNRKTPRQYNKPIWKGESLAGKTLFLFNEQGFGDNLQFARYFAQLKQQGATIVYECQQPLKRLFSAISDIDKLVDSDNQAGNFDYYLPLASLPGVLKTTIDNIPSGGEPGGAYLTVPEGDYSSIQHLLDNAGGGMKVGIFWRGSGSQANDKRLCDLIHWEPLLKHDDIAWFSLQKDYITESDEQLMQQYNVVDMRSVITDFADTAYIIKNLDLVITIDTSVAHLVGALGCEGKVILPFATDWRWGRETDVSPWYSSLKLYRQPQIADWDSVIANVVKEL